MKKELTYEELAALMKSSAGVTVDPAALAAGPDTRFTEYGLDSLGLLGIVGELENRHGIAIDGDADSCTTPRAFIEVVNVSLTAGV
ncbi:acyl carrier protein [Streptomyces sp. SL13]|uniref:Acyl carrier protein n=1 Tax=Streptantibioticus silvisoli TaxID=2705255 RepID=A0AA90H5L6_9ACTN|nr:acyl carrier protein [Streptantibioticus silvisoli]MDI5961735.1 acyl carrier protein [Streptantibioticus silvisoli]MDI5972351.1 acyl carrier protein [Streptantibioticus silvisoli]